MPGAARGSMESQVEALREAAAGQSVLLVLDEYVKSICFTCKHERFVRTACGTRSTSNRSISSRRKTQQRSCFVQLGYSAFNSFLLTLRYLEIRIRGILSIGAHEVVLDLLGIKESVELLASVAELSEMAIPPQLVEISQVRTGTRSRSIVIQLIINVQACGRLPLSLCIVGWYSVIFEVCLTTECFGIRESDTCRA